MSERLFPEEIRREISGDTPGDVGGERTPKSDAELDECVQAAGARYEDAPEWQRDLEMWLEGNRYGWREMIGSALESLRGGEWSSVLVDERSAHFEALLLERIVQRLSAEFGIPRPKFYLTEPEGRRGDEAVEANAEYLRDKDLGKRTLFLSELIGQRTIKTFAYALRKLEQPFDVMTVLGGENVAKWSEEAQEQPRKRTLTERLLGGAPSSKPKSQIDMENLFRGVRVYNAGEVPVDMMDEIRLGGILRGDADDRSYDGIRNRLSGMQQGLNEDSKKGKTLRTVRREMTGEEREMRRYLRKRIRDCADEIYEEVFSEVVGEAEAA